MEEVIFRDAFVFLRFHPKKRQQILMAKRGVFKVSILFSTEGSVGRSVIVGSQCLGA